MNTLSNKMYARFHALVIKTFKLACEVSEKIVPSNEIAVGNRMALKNTDTSYEFAEIQPIFPWQQMLKKSGTKTIDVLLEFPCFITSIEFLSGVSRRPSERGQYEQNCPHHDFSMRFPESIVLVEDCPVPR